MSPRWQEIERLFHGALERPAEEREAFVRREAGDEKIAAEVMTLLDAAHAPGGEEPADSPQPLNLHGLMEALGSAFLSGKLLGNYAVAELVGEGGMGLVYRAIDQRDGSTVAIKILPPGQAQYPHRIERFQSEARALAALRHPAIVAIREAGFSQGVHYLVMEYLEGETLERRVRRAGPLDAAEAIRCGLAVAEALEAAHQAGVTHRDLKPENVMLTAAGFKVFDFGLAHLDETESSQRTTLEGALAGTVAYLAPEQIEGAAGTPQTDIFALGVLLFEAAAGEPLFQRANPIATARAILHDDPDYSRVPVTLRPVLRRCLAKKSRRRYQSAGQVASDLKKIQSGVAVVEPRAMAWPVVAVCAIVFVVSAAWWLHGRIPRKPDPHALDSFQLGQYHWNRRTQESMLKSVDYFRQASVIDPNFAPAQGWLADSLAMLPEYGIAEQRNTESARKAARRAIELDPKLSVAHGALAWIYFSYDWNWSAAEPEFRSAIALNPNSALPHQRYALGLISRGRFQEAEAELNKAQQLDPLGILPLINRAELWFYARRFDLEETELKKILDRDPSSVLARTMLAQMHIVTGRSKEAIAETERLLEMPESSNWCQQLTLALARDGQRERALRQMSTCTTDPEEQPAIFIYLGQPARAIAMLEQRYREHNVYTAYLNVDPAFDSLRREPDFQQLLAKIGF